MPHILIGGNSVLPREARQQVMVCLLLHLIVFLEHSLKGVLASS